MVSEKAVSPVPGATSHHHLPVYVLYTFESLYMWDLCGWGRFTDHMEELFACMESGWREEEINQGCNKLQCALSWPFPACLSLADFCFYIMRLAVANLGVFFPHWLSNHTTQVLCLHSKKATFCLDSFADWKQRPRNASIFICETFCEDNHGLAVAVEIGRLTPWGTSLLETDF